MERPFTPARGNSNSIATPPSSLDVDTDSLKEQLDAWTKEQHHVASQVVIKDDWIDADGTRSTTDNHNESLGVLTYDNALDNIQQRFKILAPVVKPGILYGGVDVSFSEHDSDPAVATYVVVEGTTPYKVVYRDFLYFNLEIPYVSSFLSFREIGPLETLVHKQLTETPHLTPQVILVDGNGILHVRRAGIACFLGVRTGIPTVGVGKTLYCEDGIQKQMVQSKIDKMLVDLKQRHLQKCGSYCPDPQVRPGVLGNDDARGISSGSCCRRMLLVDKSIINTARVTTDNSSYSEIPVSVDREAILEELAPFCKGVAVKLKGASDQVLCAALLGHGGEVGVKRRVKSGAKNPIYVSVGHQVSLDEAIALCGELSQARIPEPVRQADLWGRELLRQRQGQEELVKR